jgi:aryl-alcohol dehydrogenase-like predicted oxidoreductase
MDAVLGDGDIALVASFVLAGGVLTGKYLRDERGRSSVGDQPVDVAQGMARAAAVVQLASEWGVTPASLAFSFALGHRRLASILFGATSPEQLRENVASLAVFESLDASQRARLAALATR